VIGVGSEHGNDAAGLEAAHRLQRCPLPAGVEVVACAGGGLDVLDELSGAEAVVLIDATRSGESEGTVRRIALERLRSQRGCSSHGFGVAEALELAAVLGSGPRRVEIVGIEGGLADHGGLSQAVARGVDAAVDEVLTLLRELEIGTTDRHP
jgi:hydrogenase maturation protease